MRRWSELTQVERVRTYTRQSLYAILWLGPLVALPGVAPDTDRPGLLLLAGVGLAAGLAASPLLKRVMDDHPDVTRVPWDAACPLVAVAVAAAALLSRQPVEARVAGAIMVVVPAAAALTGIRSRALGAAVVVVLAGYAVAVSWRPSAAIPALAITLFYMFTMRLSLWVLQVVAELDRARDTDARLAVAEERLRFSRDVHDVMGRRLSTIAVQSELAATLAERGDPRAGQQMLAVRGEAHDALREARELARGYRPTDLDHELEGARSLLRSAGIEVELAVDDVPPAWHEPAAWVIREAVTNVLRHSAASWVRLTWQEERLVIENDGVSGAPGPDGPGGADGTGLRGLRERLEPLGGGLTVEHDDAAGRFALCARLPAGGPA